MNKLTKLLPDKIFLKLVFYKNTGYRLSFKNPKTFNAKLQWLKVYNRDSILTMLVDKYEVKEYIKEKIGEEYIIPTVGIWDNANEIDFNKLPEQFVLKCTHDSGSAVFCKNREEFNIEDAKYRLGQALSNNYFYAGREWPYKNVKPRIMAEPYMTDRNSEYLIDYKLMCFNGRVKCSFVVTDRYSEDGLKVTFFDRNWKKMPFERHYPSDKKEIPCPAKYGQMIELAEKLSRNIIFVRVDFYEIEGKIYFGELTFSPGGGFEEFRPLEWDKKLGEWITLPVETKKKKRK
ncbi:ATP-grasp fold amidoligase family protein [Lachnospiraceae bacterium 38-10]